MKTEAEWKKLEACGSQAGTGNALLEKIVKELNIRETEQEMLTETRLGKGSLG